MSFSDLFDNEFKSRNKGHFSSIVRVAPADGALSPEEKLFLDKLKVFYFVLLYDKALFNHSIRRLLTFQRKFAL